MNILFWNVQRLGQASDTEKINAWNQLDGVFSPPGADVVLCEVHPGYVHPAITVVAPCVGATHERKLRYGANNGSWHEQNIWQDGTVWNDAAMVHYRGALVNMTFDSLRDVACRRPLVRTVRVNGHDLHLAALHAPATAYGNVNLGYIWGTMLWLERQSPGEWVLFGDLNSDPTELDQFNGWIATHFHNHVGVDVEARYDSLAGGNWISTHQSMTGNRKLLDYAIVPSGIPVTVRVHTWTEGKLGDFSVSDHRPIWIEIS